MVNAPTFFVQAFDGQIFESHSCTESNQKLSDFVKTIQAVDSPYLPTYHI
ncbi:hypothetical protein YC2023_111579 [Brassica napus]